MASITAREDIILDMLDFFNRKEAGKKAWENTKGLWLQYNHLDTKSDSLAMFMSDSDPFEERKADVTGLFIAGDLYLDVIYRDVSNTLGTEDINSLKYMRGLLEAILHDFKVDNPDYWTTEIKAVELPHISRVYDGNVKDFTFKVKVGYEYPKPKVVTAE